MLKPPRLQAGDTVGIVSPSWWGAAAFPHRVERGVAHLRSLGFEVRIAPHALNRRGHVSDTAENRVHDLHALFRDPEVRAIVTAVGGDHSCHLLPLLDFDLIQSHPTILVGFSDTTVLNVALWHRTGLVTFNGPALLTDFAEHPRMYEYTERALLRALCEREPIGVLEPAPAWTEEFQRWEDKEDLKRPRQLRPSAGWTWLREGAAEGVLVGGCLESLQHLRGTPWWPDFDDALFFFETSELKPSPAAVDAILTDYDNMGVLERLRGLVVGRPIRYDDEEKRQLRDVVLERTRRYAFPVVTDVDFGHTAPQLTLPIGCRARLDATRKRLEILEAAVT